MLNIVQFLVGFLLADFAGGIFHWFEDNYLSYCSDMPLLGSIAKDNEMHHYYPRLVLKHPWWASMSTTLPLLVVLSTVFYFTVSRKQFKKYKVLILTFLLFGTVGNVLHRFGHMRDSETNDFVKLLQKIGVLQTHQYHSVHHKTSDRRFCVVSQYLNPFLDYVHFWRGLELVVFWITGVKAKPKNTYDEYESIQTKAHAKAKSIRPPIVTKKEVSELERNLKEYMHCNE